MCCGGGHMGCSHRKVLICHNTTGDNKQRETVLDISMWFARNTVKLLSLVIIKAWFIHALSDCHARMEHRCTTYYTLWQKHFWNAATVASVHCVQFLGVLFGVYAENVCVATVETAQNCTNSRKIWREPLNIQLTEVRPGVVFCCCRPTASKLDIQIFWTMVIFFSVFPCIDASFKTEVHFSFS